MLVAGLLHRGGQVLQQVPAISDSQGVRGSFLDRLGVGGGAVPADDLGSRMLGEPGRESLGGAIGQHVHDPAGLDVDQHGAVRAALAEGELVHPQHARRTVRHRRRRPQPEQPSPARNQLQRRHNRAAGRPPSSIAIDHSQPVRPVLERRCRSDRPGTCSTNVLREQLFRSQKYLRTRTRTMTRQEPKGLSCKERWYELCVRLACIRQTGQRPGRAVDTASTTRTSVEALTRSSRTSIPGNSTASTVLLAMTGHTLPKRSLVPHADLGIHGTAARASFK